MFGYPSWLHFGLALRDSLPSYSVTVSGTIYMFCYRKDKCAFAAIRFAVILFSEDKDCVDNSNGDNDIDAKYLTDTSLTKSWAIYRNS